MPNSLKEIWCWWWLWMDHFNKLMREWYLVKFRHNIKKTQVNLMEVDNGGRWNIVGNTNKEHTLLNFTKRHKRLVKCITQLRYHQENETLYETIINSPIYQVQHNKYSLQVLSERDREILLWCFFVKRNQESSNKR